MRRNSTNREKSKSEFKVVKKCTGCEKEIPVACKICPLCKSFIVPSKPVKTGKEDDKDNDGKIRRTERIRRERPDFFNAMEVDNQFKKKRKRKESAGSTSSLTNSVKASTSSVKTPTIEESPETPKRRRGRPKSASTSISVEISDKGSDTKSPTPEEDWYGHLPHEKLQQYKIILAEINRKFSSQNFNPV
ncbi:hypothetical protein ACF0H5_010222 [Mactra antiquata]